MINNVEASSQPVGKPATFCYAPGDEALLSIRVDLLWISCQKNEKGSDQKARRQHFQLYEKGGSTL
jgi:hypothetical protein